jgi:GT2 family glycosyltransferase
MTVHVMAQAAERQFHPTQPDVSVVIVSYNTRDLLREALASLTAAAGPRTLETIVVDNMSKDGSADMVEREFPEVRLIRAERNLGFAGANNLAFDLARGRFLYCRNFSTPTARINSLRTVFTVFSRAS